MSAPDSCSLEKVLVTGLIIKCFIHGSKTGYDYVIQKLKESNGYPSFLILCNFMVPGGG